MKHVTVPEGLPTRDTLLAMLQAYAAQRPGLDPRNYGDWANYRREAPQITRDLTDCQLLLVSVLWRTSISAEAIDEKSEDTPVDPALLARLAAVSKAYGRQLAGTLGTFRGGRSVIARFCGLDVIALFSPMNGSNTP